MADSMIQDAFNLANRYKSYNPTVTDDPTINYWGEKEKYDKLYEDKSSLSFTDMLGLMVSQFQNQTIDNQASTTDMMNQLVQMSSMQAMTEMSTQIKELTLANVMSYSASLDCPSGGKRGHCGHLEREDQGAGGDCWRGEGHRHLRWPAGYLLG